GEWWSALARATRGALAESGVPGAEIAGIAVDATASTVVATDADGRPLRPAIMWMDVRARDQARRGPEDGGPARQQHLGPARSGPHRGAARAARSADGPIHGPPGGAAPSATPASGKWYSDREEGGYPASLYEAVE